jgi:hypothetical protein
MLSNINGLISDMKLFPLPSGERVRVRGEHCIGTNCVCIS